MILRARNINLRALFVKKRLKEIARKRLYLEKLGYSERSEESKGCIKIIYSLLNA